MSAVRKQFLRDVKNTVAPEAIVTAIQLPTGALEITTNTSKIAEKIDYILNAYDDDFRLKNNQSVVIKGVMLV